MTDQSETMATPAYGFEIPSTWQLFHAQRKDVFDQLLAELEDDIRPSVEENLTRLQDGLREIGVDRFHTRVIESDGKFLIMTLSSVLFATRDLRGDHDEVRKAMINMSAEQSLEASPMLSIINGPHVELLRSEAVIEESSEWLWSQTRDIRYAILHPNGQVGVVIVGTSPNVNIYEVGQIFDSIAQTFRWLS